MKEEENMSVMRQYFEEAYNRRNVAVGEEILSPNVVLHDSPVESIADWKKYATAYLTAFPVDLHITIEDIFADGRKVVARYTVQATQDGLLLGIAATGIKVSWMGIAIFYIEDGKITDIWGVNDIYSLMQQIGGIS